MYASSRLSSSSINSFDATALPLQAGNRGVREPNKRWNSIFKQILLNRRQREKTKKLVESESQAWQINNIAAISPLYTDNCSRTTTKVQWKMVSARLQWETSRRQWCKWARKRYRSSRGEWQWESAPVRKYQIDFIPHKPRQRHRHSRNRGKIEWEKKEQTPESKSKESADTHTHTHTLVAWYHLQTYSRNTS